MDADLTLDFFNSLMDTIPNQYKHVDKDQEMEDENLNMKMSKAQMKKLKKAQNQNLSMVELKERA